MTICRLLALCAVTCVASTVTAQTNLRELARNQALRDPGVPILLPSPPAGYAAKSLGQLAKESAIVVEARLVRLRSYLWESNDRVLTDYSLEQPDMIVGAAPTLTSEKPGGTARLIVTVYGGEISLDGVTVRATETNREPIDEHATYLLFLMKSRAGGLGHYEIYDGAIFEVQGPKIRPLAKNGTDIFKWALDTPRADVLTEIRAAVSRQ